MNRDFPREHERECRWLLEWLDAHLDETVLDALACELPQVYDHWLTVSPGTGSAKATDRMFTLNPGDRIVVLRKGDVFGAPKHVASDATPNDWTARAVKLLNSIKNSLDNNSLDGNLTIDSIISLFRADGAPA